MKLTILCSYAYLRTPMHQRGKTEIPTNSAQFVEQITSRDDVEILLDSGAFTALNTGREIPLDEYMAFLKRHTGFFGALALDVVGNPEGTERNLRTMLDAGLRPIPVHVLGEGQEKMDELFELSPWVACAGLRRPHRGNCGFPYLKQKMDWARGRNVHWLGYVRDPEMQLFRPYSADCASWNTSVTYGWINIYKGRGQRGAGRPAHSSER